MQKCLITSAVILFCSASVFANSVFANVVLEAPLVSISSHDAYFDNLRAHCGKAYAGKVVLDNPKSDGFDGPLIMHVRKCSDTQLQIPFHVGNNHSRTWIISKTGSGLSLKHDHRKQDGSYDESTMYGGHTLDAGWANVQSFPADQYSKEMFVRLVNPQSNTNIWQMYIYPTLFSYRLIREGREFRVDFDLTKPLPLPPTPWGYQD
uniref:Secreted protein n=1 Tax=Rheinheimera sp. BAL341 TaxID=1708203 RepID=A0A486XPZ6_9GAMM